MPILYHPTIENVRVDSSEELVDAYTKAGWLKKAPDYSKTGTRGEIDGKPIEEPVATGQTKPAAKKTAARKTAAKKK